MQDSYIEEIVKCNPPSTAGATKVLMIIMCFASIFVWFVPVLGMIATAVCIGLTVWVFRNFDYEYEYTYTENTLDVDKIIAKSGRKKLGSFDFSRLELMAPVNSQEALRLERADYKTYDYRSNTEGAKVYVAYPMLDNAVVRVLFEPSEKLCNAIEYSAPRKVIRYSDESAERE